MPHANKLSRTFSSSSSSSQARRWSGEKTGAWSAWLAGEELPAGTCIGRWSSLDTKKKGSQRVRVCLRYSISTTRVLFCFLFLFLLLLKVHPLRFRHSKCARQQQEQQHASFLPAALLGGRVLNWPVCVPILNPELSFSDTSHAATAASATLKTSRVHPAAAAAVNCNTAFNLASASSSFPSASLRHHSRSPIITFPRAPPFYSNLTLPSTRPRQLFSLGQSTAGRIAAIVLPLPSRSSFNGFPSHLDVHRRPNPSGKIINRKFYKRDPSHATPRCASSLA